jgi:Druantia protein DruA
MGRTDAVDWVEAGREFSAEEIGEIRKMVAWLPGLARKELAGTVCEHLQWHTAAGTAKLQACQKLLERLEAAGLLELPALRRKKNHSGNRSVVALRERTATDRPLAGPLRELEPVRLEVVTEASDVGLWSEYVGRFHPLGYKGAFGYRLRYFIRSGTQRLGCVLLAGAARAIAVGDRWIGWNERARLRNLPRVIDNSRFLIFAHVQILHLASHVLGQLARRASADWQRQWGFSPLLMETFVDPRRYTGTCYRAAGWKLLGQTSGRGLARPGKSYRSTPRLVLVKPLDEDFRWLLCAAPLPGRVVQ